MNFFHYTPGYLSLSRKNLSWHKNNFHSFPHISLLSTLALLKNWGIVFLPAAPRPAFSSNHTPQSVGRKLTTLRERRVRIAEAEGSNPFGSTRTETPVSCLKLGLFLCLSGFFATLVLSLFACFCGCLSIFVREKFVKINRPPSPRLWGGGVLLYRGKLAGGGLWLRTHLPFFHLLQCAGRTAGF